ncbi:unnamed protein product [Caenorhabditis angaria]|uniref:F-box domain-containing protein n=1 Tax=Caenorhabditis angaria TaxID=860376 RepID=A0A9P1I867_9PELO|nr:unnamed protein product [Caenorhabditis angaria]
MSSTSKKRRIEEDPIVSISIENDQTSWFDLPLEMRENVIDEMDPNSKCRFTICSKKCEDEVKKSMDYLKSIKITRGFRPEIYIGHDALGFHYCLDFVEISNLSEPKTYVFYKTTTHPMDLTKKTVIKWVQEVDGKADHVQSLYLNKYLERYHKSIIRFEFNGYCSKFDQFNFKMLKNLIDIEIRSVNDIIKEGSMDKSQVISANWLKMKEETLDFDDILKFNGLYCKTKCNDFDVEKAREYLKMLKDGRIHRNLNYMHLKTNLDWNDIDLEKVTEGLEVLNYNQGGWDYDLYCKFEIELETYMFFYPEGPSG